MTTSFDHFHHDLGEIRRRVLDGALKEHETIPFSAGLLCEIYVEQAEMIAVREASKGAVGDAIKRLEDFYAQIVPRPVPVLRVGDFKNAGGDARRAGLPKQTDG